MIKPRKLSGFPDYNEAENAALAHWLFSVEKTYRTFGFTRLTPRPFERREVLLSKGGLSKQIFGISRLQDDAPTDMALPFDRTIPLAHWVALYAGEMVFPYKRYDVGYSYRGERPQEGRFMGFFQADVDIIGLNDLGLPADAECVAVIYRALQELGAGAVTMKLNNIPLAKALVRKAGVSEEMMPDALRELDKLGKIGVDKTIEQLTTVVGVELEAAQSLVEVMGYEGDIDAFPVPEDEVAAAALADLKTVWGMVIAQGVAPEAMLFCPGIVRGLDYYTGTVFETFLDGLEDRGSIASGGRYDDLASTFTKLKLPGVGGSIGISRLFDVLRKQDRIDLSRKTEAEVFVGFRSGDQLEQAQQLATALREAGKSVDLYSGTGNTKKQFSYADRKGFNHVVIVMGSKSIVVKDLAKGSQEDVADISAAVGLFA